MQEHTGVPRLPTGTIPRLPKLLDPPPRRGPLSRVEDLRDDSAELVLESPDALPLLGEHPDRVRAQGMPSAPRVSTDSRPCYDRPRGGSVGASGSPAGSRRSGFVLGTRRVVPE